MNNFHSITLFQWEQVVLSDIILKLVDIIHSNCNSLVTMWALVFTLNKCEFKFRVCHFKAATLITLSDPVSSIHKKACIWQPTYLLTQSEIMSCLLFLFLAWLTSPLQSGFCTRGLAAARQALYYLSHTPRPHIKFLKPEVVTPNSQENTNYPQIISQYYRKQQTTGWKAILPSLSNTKYFSYKKIS
jgi:hypothetical protein